MKKLIPLLGVCGLAALVRPAQTNYITIFDTALRGDWQSQNWEAWSLPTDFNAAAPGRPGVKAIEVNFTNSWDGFGLTDMKPGWDIQWNYLNEVRTVEFDIYFAVGSTGRGGSMVVPRRTEP